MQRTRLFLLSALALAAVLVAWLMRAEPAAVTPIQPAPTSTSPRPDAATADRSAAHPSIALAPTSAEPARSTAEVAASESVPVASSADTGEMAVLSGRVVDARAAPIADARVQLRAVSQAWAPGRDVPKKTVGKYTVEGYEARTGADGRFRIEVAVPTADWITMDVQADAFHARDLRNFGPAGGRNEPRITSGGIDFGDIALASCGVLRGTVRGSDGTPIEKARLSLSHHFPGGVGVQAVSNADGSFELGGMPPGTWTVGAQADGWLVLERKGIEITVDRVTEGAHFVLERAPSIAGIVVDTTGAPLEGVRVWGWPVGSGRGAGAKSGADGRFTLFVAQDEPHDLEVTRQAAYEDWGAGRSPSETFAPGTSDVRIVLTRSSRITFRVLDAASGAPIPTFTIALEKVPENGMSWNRFDRLGAPREAPNGEVELSASVGKQDVGVTAPGYAAMVARVAVDAGTTGVQTLRLVPESRIVARLVRAGAPLSNATVWIEREAMLADPAADPEDFFAEKRWDVDEFAGRRRSLLVDASGSLRIGELAAGTYRMTIEAPGVARTVRSGLVAAAGAELDLGTIELAAASRIAGRVVVPSGSSAIGMELRVDERFDRETRITSADGSFTIDGLEPGTHTITLQAMPPLLVSPLVEELTLGPGETRELVLDLVARAPCTVELEIVCAGRPLNGVLVTWSGTSQHTWTSQDQRITSDERGIARGLVPGGEPGTLWLQTGFGRRLREVPIPAGLPAGGLHRERIELALGQIVLELPRDLAIPETGSVNVFLSHGDDRHYLNFHTKSAAMPFFGDLALVWTSSTLEADMIPAGEYTLSVDAHVWTQMENMPAGQMQTNSVFAVRDRTIRVEVGKTTTVDLR